MILPVRRLLLSVGLLVLLFSLYVFSSGASAPSLPTPQPDISFQVEQAITREITASQTEIPVYILYDIRLENLRFSADSTWAIAYLVPVDLQTGYVIPSEPALALARWVEKQWEVYLPHHPQWTSMLQSIPADLVSGQDKTTWLEMYRQNQFIAANMATLEPFSGYKLPWQAGISLVLTRSITHYSPPDPNGSMHYAFDFAARHDSSGQSSMFPVLAAKPGRVKYVRWQQDNGSETSPGNYLVLEDTTTTPTTYQLYLHLAKESIPESLRIIGTPVSQGQFIGMADDTGYSTGNHLHFQVHTNPSSYWGSSVDIVFQEVGINGGRPRTPVEAQNYPQYGNQGQWEYVSANTPLNDLSAPSGTLTLPENGVELTTGLLTIVGSASDDEGIATIRLKANYSNAWQHIGPIFNSSPISYTWDLCQSQVPDGPISLALEIQDISGKLAPGLPGLRHVLKNYTCPPPPTCVPSANQVALFAEPDFGGACSIFDISDTGFTLSALGSVGNDNAESIKVGKQAMATLFILDNFRGRGETFTEDDSNLSDNLIGANRVSSLFVQQRDSLPSTPLPLYPSDSAYFSAGDLISLSWENLGGVSQFRVKLNNQEKDWQTRPFLHLDSLSPGTYTWQVQARNANGLSPWSPQRSFTIRSSSDSVPTVTAPFTDTMESGYNGWNPGAWDQNLAQNHTPGGRISWRYEITSDGSNYDNGKINSGYLTSPKILIPKTGFALRFWYLYETEDDGQFWDQRWVQISDNGGPFVNVLQLSDDPQNVWLPSPLIDLSAYAGHTIQVRFYFATLDANNNNYKGWYMDDFVIKVFPPSACSETIEPDESPNLAQWLEYNSTLSGQICPSGDVDYFRFIGKAGDQIGIATQAQSLGSPLDTSVFLLDGDFASILAQNDDRYPGTQTDSYLSYRLTRDGTYYVKLRAWNHPSAGGSDHSYLIALYGNDTHDPVASISSLTSNAALPDGLAPINITANDPSPGNEAVSGVSHVEFFWHPGDWELTNWIFLGADWDDSDDWGYNWDTSSIPEQSGIGIFARIYDWAGNWRDVAVWNLYLFRHGLYLPLILW